jgi:hypothetical protein
LTNSTGGEKVTRFFGSNDSGPRCIVKVDMICDTTELDDDNTARAVLALEIQHSTSRLWECRGLVLRRACCGESDDQYGGTIFRRVGVFDFVTFNLRKNRVWEVARRHKAEKRDQLLQILANVNVAPHTTASKMSFDLI